MQWIDPSKLAGLPMEQTTEVVTHHRWVLATVLKQESCNGRLHQAVLIPMGMFLNECPHGAMQILR